MAEPRLPQLVLVLMWLVVLLVYADQTKLPPIGRPSITPTEEAALETGATKGLHLMVASRNGSGLDVEETVKKRREVAAIALLPDGAVKEQLGQFELNDLIDTLYLDLASSERRVALEYREWADILMWAAFGCLLVLSFWTWALDSFKGLGSEGVWRLSLLTAVTVVAVLHSAFVYYQGGLLISPVGQLTGAVVPLILAQVVLLWRGWRKSVWSLVPVAVFVAGHAAAHLYAAKTLDPTAAAVMASNFELTNAYWYFYMIGVVFGVLSVGLRREEVAHRAAVRLGSSRHTLQRPRVGAKRRTVG